MLWGLQLNTCLGQVSNFRPSQFPRVVFEADRLYKLLEIFLRGAQTPRCGGVPTRLRSDHLIKQSAVTLGSQYCIGCCAQCVESFRGIRRILLGRCDCICQEQCQ